MASSSQNRPATATRGGASSIATPANDGSSGIFGGTGPAKVPFSPSSPTKSSSIDAGKRRTSQDGGSLFGNLHTLKRSSQDMGTSQRKSSMSEQTMKPGIIGSMWNSWTKGDK